MIAIIKLRAAIPLFCIKNMKAKTIIELINLSTNLYMLTKDEEVVNRISKLATTGKEKISELYENISEAGEGQLMELLMHKAAEAKIELEHRISEFVIESYDKLKIAHTNEIKRLEDEINNLKTELALTEARVVNLEAKY